MSKGTIVTLSVYDIIELTPLCLLFLYRGRVLFFLNCTIWAVETTRNVQFKIYFLKHISSSADLSLRRLFPNIAMSLLTITLIQTID